MRYVKYAIGALVAALILMAFAPIAVPSKPGLSSPVGKAVLSIDVATDVVTLKWKNSTPTKTHTISDYDLEVSESSAVNAGTGDFMSTVDTANVAAPTIQYDIPAATLDFGKTYYWHVRANDSFPSTSAWSSIGVFRVGIEPPTPTPLLPPPALDLLTLRPTFQWTPGLQNADSYTIEISTDGGFSTKFHTATISSAVIPANQYKITVNLNPNIDYFWRIRANNSLLGASTWSVVETFHSANPPSVPVLISPNKAKVPPTPTLTWHAVSIPGATVFTTYQIEIFDTNVDVDNEVPVFTANDTVNDAVAPAPSLALQTTESYTVPAGMLNPTTTYYWRVKAINGDDEYSASSLFTFYTSIVGEVDATTMDPSETLGNVPGLQGPAVNSKSIPGFTGTEGDNINLLSLHPTFKWDPGALNAQTFNLQVASQASGSCNVADPETSSFATTIINVSLPYSQSEYEANLEKFPNYVLCWRIRGVHSVYGSSDWSDVQMFLTANPPGVPTLVEPNDGTLTNDNSPKLVWNKVTLPSGTTFAKYEVEISLTPDFKDYYFPNTVPPYLDTPIVYPLDSPPLPGDIVTEAVLPVVPPVPLPPLYATDFPLYPQIAVAHHTNTLLANFGTPNSINESWFQIHEEFDTLNPVPTYGPLYGAHTYYWRVRSYNSYGEYSAWSLSRSVKIYVDVPVNLEMTDCAGAVILDAIDGRPCFEWDDVYGAHKYIIDIATKNTFGSSTILTAYPGGSHYQPVKDLPKNVTLYWRVKAVNTATYKGIGLASEVLSFLSANPPEAPKLKNPILNKLELLDTPTFTWGRPYVPFGTVFDYYEIEIAQDANFAFLVEPPAQTTPGDEYETFYTIGAGTLTPARKYYWHVRACNAAAPSQCSGWSSTFYFRLAVAETTLVTPPDMTNPVRPLFEWSAVNDATNYTIWISKKVDCTSPVISANTSGLSYKPTVNLVTGTTYYWCVRANNAAYGPGAWSAIDSFVP